VVLIPQDSYYRDNSHLSPSERQEINFDHPRALEFNLLARHVEMLKEGKSIDQPVYSYLTCTRLKETIEIIPRQIIIIEGILILTSKILREPDGHQGFC
jgi:uridine kinase